MGARFVFRWLALGAVVSQRRASLHWRPAAVLALLSLLLLGKVALAQKLDDTDPDVENARRHFAVGTTHYQARDYAKALKEFQAARLIKPLPALDYNIARCYERLERYPDAIASYQRFLDAAPNDEDARDARERIRVLSERIRLMQAAEAPPQASTGATPTPASSPPPTSPLLNAAASPESPASNAHGQPSSAAAAPPAPEASAQPNSDDFAPPEETLGGVRRPSSRRFIAPIIVGVAALGLLGAGIGLYVSASSSYESLKTSCSPNCTTDQYGPTQTTANASYALLAVGGAAAAADVALWAYFATRKRPTSSGQAWIVPNLAPGGAGVVVGGAF